ncbi:lactonase family protein [Nostocoides australiense]
MRTVPTIFITLALGATTTVAPGVATAAVAPVADSAAMGMGNVYALTNDPMGNAVVAYTRDSMGMLMMSGTYLTGGKGASLHGAVVDRTASQGALAADRRHGKLYAVNPGSNTLTVFSMTNGMLKRTQTVSTHGTFPVSVAVSPDGMRVFVLNARRGGSIQGYQLVDGRLVAKMSWNRKLMLDTMSGTDMEFVSTPGQVGFSPDGRNLIVTTKASSHSILVWPMTKDGAFRTEPTVNTIAGAVPFAFDFDMHGRLNVANAGTGTVGTYGIRSGGMLMPYGQTPTKGEAVCWLAVHDDLIVSSNTGSNTVTSLRSRAAAPVRLGVMKTGAAPVDSTFSRDGRYFYVQTGGTNMIETYRVSATGVLKKMDADTLPGPIGSEGIVAW